MTEHADIVRENGICPADQMCKPMLDDADCNGCARGLAALDALVAELAEARDRGNMWCDHCRTANETATRYMHAAEAAEADRDRLREALAVYADHRNWGIEREFKYPRAVWIGPGADSSVPDAPGIARAALAADSAGGEAT